MIFRIITSGGEYLLSGVREKREEAKKTIFIFRKNKQNHRMIFPMRKEIVYEIRRLKDGPEE